MTSPRLEIRLDHLRHNAATLVDRLAPRGIRVTGVTKATMGSPQIAETLLTAGVSGLGESRIENVESLRSAGITAPITLIRTPMMTQVERVVAAADVSHNTDVGVIRALSAAAGARGKRHGIVVMVELGDLREGVMADHVAGVVEEVRRLPHVELAGIGANLACQSGVRPDATNMGALSDLVASLEHRFETIGRVSGGNSANLAWALDDDTGRINDLRLGESILLGLEPSDRRPIDGLHLDAFSLTAEVIESSVKPGRPWGDLGETAFGPADATPAGPAEQTRLIVALGRQDVDPDGLDPPPGTRILGASSDHLVLESTSLSAPTAGTELTFGVVGYAALLQAVTSPFVAVEYLRRPAQDDAGVVADLLATEAIPN